MTSMVEQFRFFSQWLVARMNIKSDKGATAVEYGLMVALIAAVIIIAVVALGQQTRDTFQCTADSVAARANNCP